MLWLCMLRGHFVCTWSTECSYLKFLFRAAHCTATVHLNQELP